MRMEEAARKELVKSKVTELKKGLHNLSGLCLTSTPPQIIHAVFRLLDAIQEDETLGTL